MFKLMKYEFRKLSTTLLAMLGALAALEVGFIAGVKLDKNGLTAVCVTLISILVFVVYAYIILAGMTSYSRELKEKSGYLIFMTPVSPLGVVLSKLLFTALTALVATALFGVAAFFDIRLLMGRLDLDPKTLDQINMVLRLGLKANATVQQILQQVGFWTLTVLIEVILTMCTAYLAITLSATLLQNKKGFLRGLISVVLFVALSWGSGWLTQKLLYNKVAIDATFEQMRSVIGWSLLLNAVFCALFIGASAWLLDRKVNL
jgi:hypothetical protein